ncbi:MAG TPA: hypothetical protein VMB74_01135 [Streptosporangiaceae bacterium]|nr:hypothetical protein [Streptosporangiaceae bacterium]
MPPAPPLRLIQSSSHFLSPVRGKPARSLGASGAITSFGGITGRCLLAADG